MKNYKILSQEILNEIFRDADFVKPKCAGVYLVSAVQRINNIPREYVLYVGSAKNIESRVLQSSHHYMMLYNNQPDLNIITRSYLLDDYIKLEKELINFFNPLLNTHGKKRPSGIILY